MVGTARSPRPAGQSARARAHRPAGRDSPRAVTSRFALPGHQRAPGWSARDRSAGTTSPTARASTSEPTSWVSHLGKVTCSDDCDALTSHARDRPESQRPSDIRPSALSAGFTKQELSRLGRALSSRLLLSARSGRYDERDDTAAWSLADNRDRPSAVAERDPSWQRERPPVRPATPPGVRIEVRLRGRPDAEHRVSTIRQQKTDRPVQPEKSATVMRRASGCFPPS